MPSINDYDIYIFDCDGVILDSNKLKIDAMALALRNVGIDGLRVQNCIRYFSNNFGKSRFHHIDVFINEFLDLATDESESYRVRILELFSRECRQLYLKAKLTPNFMEFISSLNGKRFVASGSEQNELREVLHRRGLDEYFNNIYGSPVKKQDIINSILVNENNKNAVMFGDALSDLEAANFNDIDFISYIPFSNVSVELTSLSLLNQYLIITDWKELM